MISAVQPLPIGNALRLFIEPPVGAARWKVLRKAADTFSGHDDPAAIVVYQGDENVTIDSSFLTNDVAAFYKPYYTDDGSTWTAGPTATGTPSASYRETTTDVLGFLRERLEAGLKVEVERGNLINELGYIQVYAAAPSLEQNLIFPLVTVHLEDESDAEHGIGEDITGDLYDAVDDEFEEAEGWLLKVRVSVVGWSLNADERIEMRKAIRRVIIGNLSLFADHAWAQISFSQQDNDAVSGEYAANVFQTMGSFTCLAPVRVAGAADTLRTIITSRSFP